ncbi:MAG TPA: DUF4339 domain-containing protein, partial [Chitinophagaceae bacterium]|nr:DUF4339 domain-containing protein [Chitinophagaceae bacterium]
LMQYFIKIDEWKTGPFDFRGISTLLITKDTLIWYEGLHGWTKAGEILELFDLVYENSGYSEKSVVELLKDMNMDVTVPHPDTMIPVPGKYNETFIGLTILTSFIVTILFFL